MYHMTNSTVFEVIIIFIIFLNTVTMSLKYYRMNQKFSDVLDQFNFVFSIIFNIEMVLKITGECHNYFKVNWNRFDCLIVIGTDLGLLLNWLNLGIDITTAVTVVRAFRVMRIVRLMKSFG